MTSSNKSDVINYLFDELYNFYLERLENGTEVLSEVINPEYVKDPNTKDALFITIDRWQDAAGKIGCLQSIDSMDNKSLRITFTKVSGKNLFYLSQKEEFTLLDRLKVSLSVIDCVKHLHEMNIVHGDVRPINIFVNPETLDIKLFNCCIKPVLIKSPKDIKGTPDVNFLSYLPPEYLDPEKFGGVDEKTDTFQVGVLLYELISNTMPFNCSTLLDCTTHILLKEPINLADVTDSVSIEFGNATIKALCKDKKDRITLDTLRSAIEDELNLQESAESIHNKCRSIYQLILMGLYSDAKKELDILLNTNDLDLRFVSNFFHGIIESFMERHQKASINFMHAAKSNAALLYILLRKFNITDKNALMNAALGLRSANKNQYAIKILRKLIDEHGMHPPFVKALAVTYLRERRKHDVIQLLQNFLETNKTYIFPYEILGELYLNEGNINKAKEYLEKALNISERSSQSWYLLGIVNIKLGDIDKAIECLSNAVQHNTRKTDAYRLLGIAYQKKMDLKSAEYFLNKAVELNPNSWENWKSLGLFYLETKQYTLAKEALRKAVELNKDSHELWHKLGVALFNLNDLNGAERAFAHALSLKKNSNYYLSLTRVYLKMNHYNEALSMVNEALKLSPNSIVAKWQKGIILYYLGHYTESAKILEEVVNIRRDFGSAWFSLGKTYLALKNYDKAQMCFENVIKLDPSQKLGFYELAMVTYFKGRLNDALMFAKKCLDVKNETLRKKVCTLLVLIAIKQDNFGILEEYQGCTQSIAEDWLDEFKELLEYHLHLKNYDFILKVYKALKNAFKEHAILLKYVGLAFYEKKDYVSAYKVLKKIANKLDDDEIYFYLGLAAAKTKHNRVAIESLEKVYQRKSIKDNRVWQYLGKLYMMRKEFEKAVEIYQELVKKASLTSAYVELTIALYNLGRYDEAVNTIQEIIDMTPQNYDAWLYYARSLLKVGELEDALEAYLKAIKIKTYAKEAFMDILEVIEERFPKETSLKKALEDVVAELKKKTINKQKIRTMHGTILKHFTNLITRITTPTANTTNEKQ